MKLKDMVYLHEVSTMREFLENNGVHGATDNEIKAFYEVFEGHGYDLFARNLKDNMFIRFDSCGSELGDIDETNEEYVSINEIGYELSYGWEMLEELYEEYWKNGEEKQAFDCGIAMNLVSDLYSRYLDRDKNRVYVVSYSSRGSFSTTDDTTVEVFYNEVDAYKDIKNSIEFEIENYNVEQDIEECNDTDFTNEVEVKKYMIDYRERDEFLLLHDEGSLQIKLTIKTEDKEEESEVKEETKMEFYTLIDHSVNENCYEDTVNVFHYRTEEEGVKNFNLIVEEYKQAFLIDGDYELGENDEVKEYCDNNIEYFELFLEGVCHMQVSLEKVVL